MYDAQLIPYNNTFLAWIFGFAILSNNHPDRPRLSSLWIIAEVPFFVAGLMPKILVLNSGEQKNPSGKVVRVSHVELFCLFWAFFNMKAKIFTPQPLEIFLIGTVGNNILPQSHAEYFLSLSSTFF